MQTLSPQRKPANTVRALAASLGAQFVPGGFLPPDAAAAPRLPGDGRLFGSGVPDAAAAPGNHAGGAEAAAFGPPVVAQPQEWGGAAADSAGL